MEIWLVIPAVLSAALVLYVYDNRIEQEEKRVRETAKEKISSMEKHIDKLENTNRRLNEKVQRLLPAGYLTYEEWVEDRVKGKTKK